MQFDELDRLSADNAGRLAVLERLCALMEANSARDVEQYVDFGEDREAAFWHGLHELAGTSAEAMERVRALAVEIYKAPEGGSK